MESKTSRIKFLKQLTKINKPYFTIVDIKKILNLPKNSLYVTCCRLANDKDLYRLKQGIYTLDNSPQNIQYIANTLYFPSYLSCESALALHGILNQIPYTSTFVTKNKTKKLTLGGQTIEYHQIIPCLFCDYILQKNLYIAIPEKALLDQLYFVSLGRAYLDYDELNLHELSKTKFLKLSKKFPVRTQKLAKELVKNFGKISITVK
ncbi:hypothetical protein KKF94_01215 [Patescibacteria group bacterium]|nr:hypothetical protein [Patescibacteria group bacterium]